MKKIILLLTSFISSAAMAGSISMHFVNETGIGEFAGTITTSKSKHGIVFTPNLQGLTPGIHGFHLHENPSCMPKERDGIMVPALAAGGHYDPNKTGKHDTPWGRGHIGDLPPLYVDASGTATQPVLAPRLGRSHLKSKAIMIHAGGDNHSDHPQPLGGGGARVVCGVLD